MVINYAKRRVKLRIERAKFQFVLIIFCNSAVLLFNFLIKNKTMDSDESYHSDVICWHVDETMCKIKTWLFGPYSRPRARFFPIWTSRPVNNIYVLLQSNGYHKRFWRKAEPFWKDSRAALLTRHSCWNTWPVDIYGSFKRFSVHYGISWKCFGPSRLKQRLFIASPIQTLASQPCSNWSLCWSVFRASVCYFVGDCSESTLEYLPLRSSRSFCNRHNFDFSVFVYTGCYKRGQTPCPVVGVEIQTGCYFEANPFDHHHFLGAVCWLWNNDALLELLNNIKVRSYSYVTGSSNLDRLSYKDFPYLPSSSKSSTRPLSTTQPNKSTEHSAIQKGSISGTVAAVCVNRLLSTTSSINKFVHKDWAIFVIDSRW